MSRLSNITPEYESLLAAACREDVAPEELHALERMADDPDSMRLLADYLQLNTDLQWLIRRQSNADKCLAMLGIEPLHDSFSVSGFDDGEAADPPLVIPALSPPPPLSTIHNPLSADFVGGPVFSYMVASVILCMMLLGGWVYKVSHVGNMPGDMANNPPSKQQYTPVFIGQITGMRDCRWGKDEPGTIVGASVPLGRKYSLESGLLQITYKTGANVILEGPCEYIADSRDGGFLRVGKLVARVNKRVASGQWLVARNKGRGPAASATSAKPQAANPESPAPSPRPPAPLFAVTTPTAVVTDLGTEFGVEVDASGVCRAVVFQGKVEVRPLGNADKSRSVQLGENESASVILDKNGAATAVKADGDESGLATFKRRIPRWIRIETFNTGVGLKPGDADSHWQIIVRDGKTDAQSRPAIVTELPTDDQWLYNDPLRSQWISTDNGPIRVPDEVYVFRTTFGLKDVRLDSVRLKGLFIADNCVQAIRLNGHSLQVPEHWDNAPFKLYKIFEANEGFAEGINVLEIEVLNRRFDREEESDSPVGLRAELEIMAMEK